MIEESWLVVCLTRIVFCALIKDVVDDMPPIVPSEVICGFYYEKKMTELSYDNV